MKFRVRSLEGYLAILVVFGGLTAFLIGRRSRQRDARERAVREGLIAAAKEKEEKKMQRVAREPVVNALVAPQTFWTARPDDGEDREVSVAQLEFAQGYLSSSVEETLQRVIEEAVKVENEGQGRLLVAVRRDAWDGATQPAIDPLLHVPQVSQGSREAEEEAWEVTDDRSLPSTPHVVVLADGPKDWCKEALNRIAGSIGYWSLQKEDRWDGGSPRPAPTGALHPAGSAVLSVGVLKRDGLEYGGTAAELPGEGGEGGEKGKPGLRITAAPFAQSLSARGLRYFAPSLGQLRQWVQPTDGVERS